jgi:hypothetical protein
MSNPEICKMLTLSTAHVSQETAALLDGRQTHYVAEVPVTFAKGDYGWFVHVPDPRDSDPEEEQNWAPDLAACIAFARGLGCDWLCLDRDGETVGDLPTYEW